MSGGDRGRRSPARGPDRARPWRCEPSASRRVAAAESAVAARAGSAWRARDAHSAQTAARSWTLAAAAERLRRRARRRQRGARRLRRPVRQPAPPPRLTSRGRTARGVAARGVYSEARTTRRRRPGARAEPQCRCRPWSVMAVATTASGGRGAYCRRACRRDRTFAPPSNATRRHRAHRRHRRQPCATTALRACCSSGA